MNARTTVPPDGDVITIHVPMTFRKNGGRKAVARAFRWRRVLDGGDCATIDELAGREKINRGYMSRVLRLTLLAPGIVEAVLDACNRRG